MTDISPREVGAILERLENLKDDVAEIKEALLRQEEDFEDRLRHLESAQSRLWGGLAVIYAAFCALGWWVASHVG